MINKNSTKTDIEISSQQIIQDLFEKYTFSKIDSILKYIQLGIILVDTKKKLQDNFYNVIDKKIMPKKEVTRAMKFVLSIKANKNYRKAMQKTNDAFGTTQRLKLFEFDTRIKDLSAKDLENMLKPSISKFNKMQTLNDNDFKKVLSGNDEPLNKIASKDEDRYKYKPTEMTDDEYDSIVKAGINPIINEYWKVKKERESLIVQLEVQKLTIEKLEESLEVHKQQNTNIDVA